MLDVERRQKQICKWQLERDKHHIIDSFITKMAYIGKTGVREL